MSMRNFPRYRAHPLQSDSSPNPAWAASSKTVFYLRDLPELTYGNQANYLAGFLVTVDATMTVSGVTSTIVDRPQDQIVPAFFSDVLIDDCWGGVLMSNNHVKGYSLDLIERLSLGGYFTRRMVPLPGTPAAARTFRFSIFVPTTFARGEKGFHHNSPLACLVKNGKITLNAPANSILTDTNNNAWAISAATMRCSAILTYDRELRLNPAHEWIEYFKAPGNAQNFTFDGLGSTSGYPRTQNGVWLDTLVNLTDADNTQGKTGMPVGCYIASTLTRLNADWAGQGDTQHVEALAALAEQLDCDGLSADIMRPAISPLLAQGSVYSDNKAGFPYTSRSYGTGMVAVTRAQTLDPYLKIVPLLLPPRDLELTKLPRYEGAQTVNRDITLIGTQTDRWLSHQYRAWTPDAYDEAKAKIIGSGVALAVLGQTNLDWQVMPLRKNNLTLRDAAILPQRLVPAVAKG
jgi:hypothetical protein